MGLVFKLRCHWNLPLSAWWCQEWQSRTDPIQLNLLPPLTCTSKKPVECRLKWNSHNMWQSPDHMTRKVHDTSSEPSTHAIRRHKISEMPDDKSAHPDRNFWQRRVVLVEFTGNKKEIGTKKREFTFYAKTQRVYMYTWAVKKTFCFVNTIGMKLRGNNVLNKLINSNL